MSPWLWRLLLVLVQINPTACFVGSIEGDTEIVVYHQGVYVFPDDSVPLPSLNAGRREHLRGTTVTPVRRDASIQVGDVFAMRVVTTNPVILRLPELEYPGYSEHLGLAAGIAAFDDGTMTNERWRCKFTLTPEEEEDWFQPNINDTLWPFAQVQEPSCCRWRDPQNVWGRLNAKWIGPPTPSPVPENPTEEFLPRGFFCRYRVEDGPPDSRLMDGSYLNASADAPLVQISSVSVSLSTIAVSYTVSEDSSVWCGIIDLLFMLRTPSPLELEAWGNGQQALAFGNFWRELTSSNNTFRLFDVSPILTLTASSIGECQELCLQISSCRALTFYEEAFATANFGNCLLLPTVDGVDFLPLPTGVLPSVDVFYQHWQYNYEVNQNVVLFAGSIRPNTVYRIFCTARNSLLQHSNLSAVEATGAEARATGCLDGTDCGSLLDVEVDLLGGFASDTSFTVILQMALAGRVYCAATSADLPFGLSNISAVTAADIEAAGSSLLVLEAFSVVELVVDGLDQETEYMLLCAGRSDSGIESSAATIVSTRRMWRTVVNNTITSMAVTTETVDGLLNIVSLTRVSEQSWLWCVLQSGTDVANVPSVTEIQSIGVQARADVAGQDISLRFEGLSTNTSHQVICLAEAAVLPETNDREGIVPTATILDVDVGYTELTLRVSIVNAPAWIACVALPWSESPVLARPLAPTPAEMRAQSLQIPVSEEGTLYVELFDQRPGWTYDLYCYAQTTPPPGGYPASILESDILGMDADDLRDTRTAVRLKGPVREESRRDFGDFSIDQPGWACTMGRPCSLGVLRGHHFSVNDRIIARSSGSCFDRCKCNGQADPDSKGALCTNVIQHRSILAPSPGETPSELDPNGFWCYVDAGLCDDESPSPIFPERLVSYLVCDATQSVDDADYVVELAAGARIATPAPLGVQRLQGYDVQDMRWGTTAVSAPGGLYRLCWCNGTETSCTLQGDFFVPIGTLHVSGLRPGQDQAVYSCVAGMPCSISGVDGYGLSNTHRMVILPSSDLGCLWYRRAFEPPAVPGLPFLGMSLVSADEGQTYSWGDLPMMALAGNYLLCWCSSDSSGGECPQYRPEGGTFFEERAGTLQVRGPSELKTWTCVVGAPCRLQAPQGVGFAAGDRVAVLHACGLPSPFPLAWSDGGSSRLPDATMIGLTNVSDVHKLLQEGPDQWHPEGWAFQNGTTVEGALERGYSQNMSEVDSNRGVWGFPHLGFTARDSQAGLYQWRTPVYALAGSYVLCWCPEARACEQPADFIVPFGLLQLQGQYVLPQKTHLRICLRRRVCHVEGLIGVFPLGATIIVAEIECGGARALPGLPNDAVSLPTADGSTYTWGNVPIESAPGTYSLCFCPELDDRNAGCSRPEQYSLTVGALRVKEPFSIRRTFQCELGTPCLVTGIEGVGLSNGDIVRTSSVCGSEAWSESFDNNGISTQTSDGGSTFHLPVVNEQGTYRVCWCAEESLCVRPADFVVDIGEIRIPGPASEAVYVCYQWRPCQIQLIEVLGLQSIPAGGRLRVTSINDQCGMLSSMTVASGFPAEGLSEPTSDGGNFSFGSADVVAEPGSYRLCLCSNCDEENATSLRAGVLDLKPFNVWSYIDDEETRKDAAESDNQLILIAVAVAIALGSCLACAFLCRHWGSRDHGPSLPRGALTWKNLKESILWWTMPVTAEQRMRSELEQASRRRYAAKFESSENRAKAGLKVLKDDIFDFSRHDERVMPETKLVKIYAGTSGQAALADGELLRSASSLSQQGRNEFGSEALVPVRATSQAMELPGATTSITIGTPLRSGGLQSWQLQHRSHPLQLVDLEDGLRGSRQVEPLPHPPRLHIAPPQPPSPKVHTAWKKSILTDDRVVHALRDGSEDE
mmetsp:Transcript_65231/g.155809  ORF Transcript_65231/g.155809 Transcript_65231/m.155809 type:complete len:1874 (+) Transcript_65231:103-5724(+)